MPSHVHSVYPSLVRHLPPAILLVLLAGCGETRADQERRAWLPTDHQQPRASEPDETAPPAPETIARAVAALYAAQCASCHGVGGRGDGPDAPPAGDLPDFTSSAYQDDNSDEDIANGIRSGGGTTPHFGDRLNERGIAALVGHIRLLRAGDSGP